MEHLMLIASPGCGKTIYARSLTKTPAATKHAVTCDADRSVIARLAQMAMFDVPFRAPHHTASEAGMFGTFRKGYVVRPGELSLAHGGVLLLDEAAEFSRIVLERLLGVMETGEVQICGPRGTKVILPAQFRLVIATNPCGCGWSGSTARDCKCSEKSKQRYLGRLQGFRKHCRVIEEAEIREHVTSLRTA